MLALHFLSVALDKTKAMVAMATINNQTHLKLTLIRVGFTSDYVTYFTSLVTMSRVTCLHRS